MCTLKMLGSDAKVRQLNFNIFKELINGKQAELDRLLKIFNLLNSTGLI